MTRYIEIRNNIVNGSVIKSKNQKSEQVDGKLLNNITMSKENFPELFRIIFIPNEKIFLLPFIFLGVPVILFNQFTQRKIKNKFWERVLISYTIILGIIGVTNFDGLKSLNIIYPYSFYFFNDYFIMLIYLFPLLYLILDNYLMNKMKIDVELIEY